jgi:cytochrome c oxidase subunit 3
VFLGIKYVEYSHKFHEGLLPGKFYSHKGDTVRAVPPALLLMTGHNYPSGWRHLGFAALGEGHFSSRYYTPPDCGL